MMVFDERGHITVGRFPVFDEWTELVAAVSTRLGGISRPPFDGLNLGLSTPDDPLHIAHNRKRFFQELGIDEKHVARPKQVHGIEVRYVRAGGFCGDADAVFTDQPNVFVTVSVADCVPILLFDPVTKACAAVHAGWRGTAAGLAGIAVANMQQTLNVEPANLIAVIGPSIGPDRYEVGEDVASQFDSSFVLRHKKKPYLDLWSANRAQLEARGVGKVVISGECTVSNPERYFSHRASKGNAGRMLAVIGRKV